MELEKNESIILSSSADESYFEQHGGEDDNIHPSVPTKYRGTAADKLDMKVIGKTQVLRVRSSAF